MIFLQNRLNVLRGLVRFELQKYCWGDHFLVFVSTLQVFHGIWDLEDLMRMMHSIYRLDCWKLCLILEIVHHIHMEKRMRYLPQEVQN